MKILLLVALAACGSTTNPVDPSEQPPMLTDAGEVAFELSDGGWAVLTPGIDCSNTNAQHLPCCPQTIPAGGNCNPCVLLSQCSVVAGETADCPNRNLSALQLCDDPGEVCCQ